MNSRHCVWRAHLKKLEAVGTTSPDVQNNLADQFSDGTRHWLGIGITDSMHGRDRVQYPYLLLRIAKPLFTRTTRRVTEKAWKACSDKADTVQLHHATRRNQVILQPQKRTTLQHMFCSISYHHLFYPRGEALFKDRKASKRDVNNDYAT